MIRDIAVYRDGRRQPGDLGPADLSGCVEDDGSWVWVGLSDPTTDELGSVRSGLGLDAEVISDAIHLHRRPSTERHGDLVVVILKTARYLDETETVEFAEIEVLMGPTFVLTVRHGEASALSGVRRELEGRPDLLAMGPGAVLLAVADHVTDDYRPVIDGIENDLGEVEVDVFTSRRTNPAERIYKLKREVLTFRHGTEPLVDGLELLERDAPAWISRDLARRFRDLHDRLERVVARLDTLGSLLSDALSANLAHVGVRQNNDMRTISAWVAIAAIPTMIGGIYGMNFRNMPELTSEYGYFVVLGVMAAACIVAYWRLRRSGWLGSASNGGDGMQP